MNGFLRHRGGLAILLCCIVTLLLPNTRLQAAEAARPTFEYQPGTTTPWTQEKVVPKEIEDKEDKAERPKDWCTTTRNDGTKETAATYADGTKVIYIADKSWTIIIPGPAGKTTKVTYDNDKKTRTVEEPGKAPEVKDPDKDPAAKDWKEGKEKEAKEAASKPKQGSWLFPPGSTRLANVAFPAHGPAASMPKEIPANSHPPLLLAATGEQPRPPESQGQGKVVVINLKIVTYGDPPSETVAFFDPGPQTTPEKFLDTPVTTANWDPKRDGGGPQTIRPGPKGIPVTEIPGGGIYIGWGWTQGFVSQSSMETCAGNVVDEDGLPPPPVPEFIRKRAEALKKADEQAKALEKQAEELEARAKSQEAEVDALLDRFDPEYLDDLSKQYLTLDEAGRGEQLDELIEADKLLKEAKEAKEKAEQLRLQADKIRDQAERNYGLPQKGASEK